MDAKVNDSPELSRYEIEVGGKLAGFAEYRRGKGVIAFTHTEIGEEFGGHGFAGKLIRTALDDAREQGLEVLPYCPFVRGFIAKHEDYADLVPAGKRAEFEL